MSHAFSNKVKNCNESSGKSTRYFNFDRIIQQKINEIEKISQTQAIPSEKHSKNDVKKY